MISDVQQTGERRALRAYFGHRLQTALLHDYSTGVWIVLMDAIFDGDPGAVDFRGLGGETIELGARERRLSILGFIGKGGTVANFARAERFAISGSGLLGGERRRSAGESVG